MDSAGSPPARGRGSKQPAPLTPSPARTSPPARGRGSKLHYDPTRLAATLVASRAGARIETLMPTTRQRMPWSSPPARGRGSKQRIGCAQDQRQRSRLPRGGADRNERRQTFTPRPVVASRAGARIETAARRHQQPAHGRSPPARGRGSKLHYDPTRLAATRRLPRGGADRNSFGRVPPHCLWVASRAGARIETNQFSLRRWGLRRRLPRGGADRNL